MTKEQVKPFIRHRTELFVKGGEPPYRAVFLCGDGERFTVNATNGAEDNFPTPPLAGLRIADINRLERLEDPPSLVDSNKVATLV
jgi:hypothetical protein